MVHQEGGIWGYIYWGYIYINLEGVYPNNLVFRARRVQ